MTTFTAAKAYMAKPATAVYAIITIKHDKQWSISVRPSLQPFEFNVVSIRYSKIGSYGSIPRFAA